MIQTAVIDGDELDVDDEIGVFTTDGLCAGGVAIDDDGFPTGFSAWGDDALTEDEVEGFQAGEQMTFRIWNAGMNIELEAEVHNIIEGGLRFQADGVTVLSLRASRDEYGRPRTWRFTRTDNTHTILIQTVTIDDEELGEGNSIGVFTPDGLCAGAVTLDEDGFPVSITAWGDDPNTEDEIEGFREDEQMTFRIWIADQYRELEAEVFDVREGELQFQVDGVTVLSLRSGN